MKNALQTLTKYRLFVNIIVLSLLYLVNVFWQGIVFVIALYLLIITMLEKDLDGIYYLSFSVAFVCIFKLSTNIYLLIPIGAVYILKIIIYNLCIEKKKLDKPMWIILGSLTLYLLLPLHSYSLLSITKTLLIIVLFVVIEFFIMNKDKIDISKLYYTYAIGLIVSSIYGLLRSVSPYLQTAIKLFPYGEYYRFSALLEHPNPLGIACIVSIATLSYLFFVKDKKIFTLLLMTIVSIIGVFTLSKAFLLMVVINYGVMWLIYMKQNWKRGLIVLGILLALLGLAYLVLHDTINVILLRFVASFQDGTDAGFNLSQITSGRTDLWIQYITHYFSSAYNVFFGLGLAAPQMTESVHNMFLAVFYEMGLIGGILFFGLLIYEVIKLIKTKDKPIHIGVILPILAVVLFSMSEDTLFYLFKY